MRSALLVGALMFVVLYYGVGGLVASSDPCVVMKPTGPSGLEGWHGDFKCWNGNVVGTR